MFCNTLRLTFTDRCYLLCYISKIYYNINVLIVYYSFVVLYTLYSNNRSNVCFVTLSNMENIYCLIGIDNKSYIIYAYWQCFLNVIIL